jgi:hypothetical protein
MRLTLWDETARRLISFRELRTSGADDAPGYAQSSHAIIGRQTAQPILSFLRPGG